MSLKFKGIGRLLPIKETEKFKAVEIKTFQSGWCQKTLNFNFAYGDFRTLMQVQFGYWGDKDGNLIPEKNEIFTMINNETTGNKNVNVRIAYNNRFNQSEIADVVSFKKFYCNTNNINYYAVSNIRNKFAAKKDVAEEDILKYNISSLAEADVLLANVAKKRHEFICKGDFLEEVEKVLEGQEFSKSKFRVAGEYEWRYSRTKGTFYKAFNLTSLNLIEDDKVDTVTEGLDLDFDFIFTKDCYNDTEYKDTGKITLNGYTKIYDSQFKNDERRHGNVLAPVSVVFIPKNDDQCKVIKKTFSTKDDTFKMTYLTANYVEGSEKGQATLDDLSDELKDEIMCGLRDLDDVLKEYPKYGDRITEIRYVSYDSKVGFKDTEYIEEDTNLPVDEVKTDVSEESKKDAEKIASKIVDDDDTDLDI